MRLKKWMIVIRASSMVPSLRTGPTLNSTEVRKNTLILTTATLVQLQKLRQPFPLQGRVFVSLA